MEEPIFRAARRVDPADVSLPAGYTIEPVATGLTFPSSVAFDDHGAVYVAEAGYCYGAVRTEARILRLEPDGGLTPIVQGLRGPVSGIAHHNRGFFVAEGGYPARISYAALDGSLRPIVEGLYGPGDHFTCMPVVGPDGWLYFGQGTYTNSGIVGPDNRGYGWLQLQPTARDVPGYDVTLTGQNYTYFDPLSLDPKRMVRTGAFVSLGMTTEQGQRIRGRTPCTGAIMRCRLNGAGLETVAWGLRNPFGLGFTPDGRFLCLDQGYDDRGVRPIGNAPDPLYEVRPRAWYGWPDYVAGEPASDARYTPEHGAPAEPLLQGMPAPQQPLIRFGPHAAAMKFDLSRDGFGFAGQLFVAEFGAGVPVAAPVGEPVGHRIARVDLASQTVETFAANRQPGPASHHRSGGLERPIEARLDPAGESLYVVDLGILDTRYDSGVRPYGRTGVLWRIARA